MARVQYSVFLCIVALCLSPEIVGTTTSSEMMSSSMSSINETTSSFSTSLVANTTTMSVLTTSTVIKPSTTSNTLSSSDSASAPNVTFSVTSISAITMGSTSSDGNGSGDDMTSMIMPDNISTTTDPSMTGTSRTLSVMDGSTTAPNSATLPALTSSTLPSTISPTPSRTFTPSFTSTPSIPTQPPALWAVVGVAGGLILLLIVITLILFIYVLYKVHGRSRRSIANLNGESSPHKRKTSSSSNKKLVECMMEEISNDLERDKEELIFGHLSGTQFSSLAASSLPVIVKELHKDDGYQAEEEYDGLKKLDVSGGCSRGDMPCNASRNRYTNILPKDSTRVVLPIVNGSDYINANFICGFTRPKEYIACQGPLPNTVADFWRMVWETNVQLIVMVANTEENGMPKCEQYWPIRGMGKYGNINVTLVSQVLYPEFVVREFMITVTGKGKRGSRVGVSKAVSQYHFTTWPDFGVPREASSMIKFVRRVRDAVKDTGGGPILTHCSAGVGRTGTYIAVDILIQCLDAEGVINVQEVVARMRAQRDNMVQTPAQYLFIYDSLLHYYLFGHTEVKAEALKEYVTGLNTPAENGDTPLDLEFKHMLSLKMPPDYLFSVALEDEKNANKNRDPENVPLDDNRVELKDPSLDSDYINASYITGYYNRVEFIATQSPLPNTVGNFWRMIWEKKVQTLIILGPVTEEKDQYWPSESSDPLKCEDSVTVKLVESEWVEEAGLIIRRFIVKEKNDSEELDISQFHLQSWPVGEAPSETHPISTLIKRSRDHWRDSGYSLIVVHTSPDVSSEAAGVYCGLCVLLRQLEVEKTVNVLTALRALRKQRPGILTSKDYYGFMYRVLESHQEEQ